MKYRKKPIEIEAFQMTLERRMDNSEWPNWLNQAWNGNLNEEGTLQRANMSAELPDSLEIVTKEGKHLVSWGDYIIRGIQGEIYHCKPDIFKLSYEPVLPMAADDTSKSERKQALEEAAAICEAMVIGGRAWTKEQAIAADALFAAANNIREWSDRLELSAI